MTGERFAGHRGLVTGGASGIGLAAAEILVRDGAAVTVLDARRDALEETASRLGARAVVADVADPLQVAAAVDDAAWDGPFDVLVNAAAIYRIEPLLSLEAGAWDEVLHVNLRGSYMVAREVVRGLVAAGRGGALVNVGSIAARVADGDEPAAHYSASKAGVLALTRQMAVEWAPYGIRANAVCPGVIDTPMLRLMDDPERGRTYLDGRVPLRRLGTPEEVAAVIAFLGSGDASYVTGAAIPVDGGILSW